MARTNSNRGITAACFGESLWDILPDGIFVGGAPLNVAYHLSRQGIATRIITAVGRDFLGAELIRRITGWGLDDRWVARLRNYPTGTVRAALDAGGAATYDIRRRVAWDHISISSARRAPAPAVLVYGTLALRDRANRDALQSLCSTWSKTWRVLDLNLREPFTAPAVIKFALQRAQMVTLNDDELGRMVGGTLRTPAAIERAARAFADAHGLTRVCTTAGAKGAGLLWEGKWYWDSGRRVVVRDTVGAGDAFLAGFLAAVLLRQESPRAALAHACRMGEFVATRSGATPRYTVDSAGRPRGKAIT